MTDKATKTAVVEDDVDDLDCLVDEFTKVTPPSVPQAASPSTKPASADKSLPEDEDFDFEDDDFAQELAKGMADLIKEMGSADDEAFKKSFEAMMGNSAPVSGTDTPAKAKNESFQETVARTMDKMKQSDQDAKEGMANSANDPLAAIMAQMESMGLGTGADGEESFAGAIEGMMQELMSKELLYEPIKDLNDKFPDYFQSEEAKSLSDKDRKRYQRQSELVKEITKIFESPEYDDDNAGLKKRVTELTQEMQECGAPPKVLMGDLGESGLELDEDGLPKLPMDENGMPKFDPENCRIA